MIAGNLKPKRRSESRQEPASCHTITVPSIPRQEAQNAYDIVEIIRERYSIADDDIDLLYNAFLTVYVRKRIVELS